MDKVDTHIAAVDEQCRDKRLQLDNERNGFQRLLEKHQKIRKSCNIFDISKSAPVYQFLVDKELLAEKI